MVKNHQRMGSFTQFGKGEHSCPGEKLGKMFFRDIWWKTILGDIDHSGYDVEIVSGLRDGVGIDNVGVEGAWATDNLGTPFEKGGSLMVRFVSKDGMCRSDRTESPSIRI